MNSYLPPSLSLSGLCWANIERDVFIIKQVAMAMLLKDQLLSYVVDNSLY